jgi:hypothetical protein
MGAQVLEDRNLLLTISSELSRNLDQYLPALSEEVELTLQDAISDNCSE